MLQQWHFAAVVDEIYWMKDVNHLLAIAWGLENLINPTQNSPQMK